MKKKKIDFQVGKHRIRGSTKNFHVRFAMYALILRMFLPYLILAIAILAGVDLFVGAGGFLIGLLMGLQNK